MITIPRPFEGRYGVMLTIAILALAPFIVVTTAYGLYSRQLQHDLHASKAALEVIAGIATAGYAFGALLGGDLIQRIPQRRLFMVCETLFVTGCLVAGAASGVVAYGAGRVLFGFATGLLLVVALPPVVQNFPADRMPITAAFVNIGFFGAVCAGPLVGGAVADGHVWRWFYGALAAIGVCVLLLSLLTLPDQKPFNPGMSFDRGAILLAVFATALPFWASGELSAHDFGAPRFTVPMGVGLACFLALLLSQYHRREPLSPVKQMWTTIPVVGTLVAMVGGAALVTFLEAAEQLLMEVAHRSPYETGIVFWPQVVGVLVTAALLGALVRTRFLPVLILAGMVVLMGSGGLLLTLPAQGAPGKMLAVAGLLGLGAGATVAPGLWLAGFSLPSQSIGRIFALVELVRSEADFILAPVMLRVARNVSGGKHLTAAGIHEAVWLTLLVTLAFTVLGLLLYLSGRTGLPLPDLEGWLAKRNPAVHSPPLGAVFRGGLARTGASRPG